MYSRIDYERLTNIHTCKSQVWEKCNKFFKNLEIQF